MSEDITDKTILERICSYSHSGRSPSDTIIRYVPYSHTANHSLSSLSWSTWNCVGSQQQTWIGNLGYSALSNFDPETFSFCAIILWEKQLGWDGKLTVEQTKTQLQGAKERVDPLSLAHLVNQASQWAGPCLAQTMVNLT